MKRNIAILAAVCIVIIAVGGTWAWLATRPPPELKVLTVGMQQFPGAGADPAIASESVDRTVNQGIMYEMLVRQIFNYDTKTMEYVPELATSWTMINGSEYEYKLRQGVQFHCGHKFNATDVKYTCDRVLTWDKVALQDLGPLQYGGYCNIVDEYTVRIGCNNSSPLFLNYIVQDSWDIICPIEAERYGWDDYGMHPCGTGPFNCSSISVGEQFTFDRFPGYWGTKPYYDRIILKKVASDNTRVIALENGELDMIDMYTPPEKINELKDRGFQIRTDTGSRVWTFIINTQGPLTNDSRVRKALNYAINREEMISTILSNSTVVNPSVFGYGTFGRSELSNWFTYDPEKAKALLAEVYPNGLPRPLKCIFIPGGKQGETSEACINYWHEIGIDVENTVMDKPAQMDLTMAYLEKVYNGEANASDAPWDLIVGGYGDPVMDAAYIVYQFYDFVYPPEPITNIAWCLYNNTYLHTLAVEAQRDLNQTHRLELYSEIQDIIFDATPFVWTFPMPIIAAAKPGLTGFTVVPTGAMVLRYAYMQE